MYPPPIGEDYFVRAREFIPERWTSSPELVLNVGPRRLLVLEP